MVAPAPGTPTPPGSPLVRFPRCARTEDCPEPHYTGFARQQRIQGSVRVLVTVNENGEVEDARAVGGVEEGLARASVESVKTWHLTPAVWRDGKPFKIRVPVEVTFRFLP